MMIRSHSDALPCHVGVGNDKGVRAATVYITVADRYRRRSAVQGCAAVRGTRTGNYSALPLMRTPLSFVSQGRCIPYE